MQMRKYTEPFRILLYVLFTTAMLFLRFVGNNAEPLHLALAYAMGVTGLSPFSPLLYLLVSIPFSELTVILLSAAQTLLLISGNFLQKRQLQGEVKTGFFTLLALSLSLGGFIAFSPFTPYTLPTFFSFTLNASSQKVIIAALTFLLAAVFSVALKALLKKFLKCRLQGEEIVFCVTFFVLVGVGICQLLGLNAYLGISFFILLVFSAITKDFSGAVCAFTLSLPAALVFGISPERFFLYGVSVCLFMKAGRAAAACALLTVFFAYGYADGLYALSAAPLTQAILSAIVPAVLFVLLPTPLLRELENKLVFYREKHLSRIAINRNRAAIGKQLFEISSVFREIQTTFASLGTTEAEEGAKEYVRACVIEDTCKHCGQYRVCLRKESDKELDKLIDVGCLKGKVSLIDMPAKLGELCIDQSSVLYAVNRQLGDYKKYMAETENAASGRSLLAGQAQGVSEILKNLALEQSEPLRIYSEKERALSVALLTAGIVCSEVLIYGEDPTLSLITYGRADVKKIAAVASHLFDMPMMISERIALNKDKYCCILRKKPYFDAAFGVAAVKKAGETASGDTHSVIRIDERKFLVALSDGMGSGEYARRISESTISLLESFYRAKMPSETVLSTINKLLTFSKEETFACVDIAVVDLDDGRADVVKIGSPVGFILSGNTVRLLENASLPLGILDSLHPDPSAYELLENDTLLFLSDGVTDAFGSTSDLYEILKTLPSHNPQQLADSLLERALQAYGGIAKDDMTALAVRLFKAA